MNFSQALELMKVGKWCNRKGWLNDKIWVFAQIPDENSKMTEPYLVMAKANKRFPCDLSCESIFAEDWQEMPE